MWNKWWHEIDHKIIFCLIILFSISILLVTSSSAGISATLNVSRSYFIVRHFVYVALSLVIIYGITYCNQKYIQRLATIGLFINIILLVAVKVYGYEIKGAKRWINVFGFSIQPSEFIKPFFMIFSATLIRNNKLILLLTVYFSIIGLLLLQPDFGMFLLISIVFGIQLFISELPIIFLSFGMLVGILTIIILYLLLPHIRIRLDKFLNPAAENYQANKSIEAFTTGGLYGKGIEEGSIKRLLPDSHSDFIFAVAAEEFGAIMCFFISNIFCFIVIRGFIRLIDEKDKFKLIATGGILAQIGIQSIINMGVALNILPTKGMTLPIISYGGSSLLATSICFGILLALTRNTAYDIYMKKFHKNDQKE